MGLIRATTVPWRYIERAARIRQRDGVLGLASRVLHKALAPLVDWGGITFFERDLRQEAPAAATPGVTVREIGARDLDDLDSGLDPDQHKEDLVRRFTHGDRAFAASADEACAHTRWLTTTRAYIPEIDREIVLGPRQAYFYNGYTEPEYRGRGVDGAVRSAIFSTLGAEGCGAVYSYVRRDNPAGLRAAARWQRPVGSVWFVRLGWLRPWIVRSTPRTLPTLHRPAAPLRQGGRPQGSGDAPRAEAWRRWFQNFAAEPLSKRSTGCDALPDAYFQSAAAFIADTLHIGPADHVLDVGCDSAMISRLIAPRSGRFTGLDLIADMLSDARDRAMPPGSTARFVAADGRLLPLRSAMFHKVYCSAMLHTLPAREDGLAVIDELVRVTADGGLVLLCSVPDRARRLVNRRLIWQRASLAGKLTLPIRWLIPTTVKQQARRVLRRPPSGPPAFLDYDLRAIARRLEARGLTCTVIDFPASYWSSDFRQTRANLLIKVRQTAGVPGEPA